MAAERAAKRRDSSTHGAAVLFPTLLAAIAACGATDPESGRQTAAVFAADGRALASLDLPRRVSIHDIGVDYLLAGAIDDLGVESVRLYPLERTHGCRPS